MAAQLNLYLNTNSSFFKEIVILDPNTNQPIDLTGLSLTSNVKTSYYTSNTVFSFNCATLNPVGGKILLSLDVGTATNVATLIPQKFVYDVLGTQAFTGIVSRLIEGQVIIDPSVTKITTNQIMALPNNFGYTANSVSNSLNSGLINSTVTYVFDFGTVS